MVHLVGWMGAGLADAIISNLQTVALFSGLGTVVNQNPPPNHKDTTPPPCCSEPQLDDKQGKQLSVGERGHICVSG